MSPQFLQNRNVDIHWTVLNDVTGAGYPITEKSRDKQPIAQYVHRNKAGKVMNHDNNSKPVVCPHASAFSDSAFCPQCRPYLWVLYHLRIKSDYFLN